MAQEWWSITSQVPVQTMAIVRQRRSLQEALDRAGIKDVATLLMYTEKGLQLSCGLSVQEAEFVLKAARHVAYRAMVGTEVQRQSR
jgi:hypothetical protein